MPSQYQRPLPSGQTTAGWSDAWSRPRRTRSRGRPIRIVLVAAPRLNEAAAKSPSAKHPAISERNGSDRAARVCAQCSVAPLPVLLRGERSLPCRRRRRRRRLRVQREQRRMRRRSRGRRSRSGTRAAASSGSAGRCCAPPARPPTAAARSRPAPTGGGLLRPVLPPYRCAWAARAGRRRSSVQPSSSRSALRRMYASSEPAHSIRPRLRPSDRFASPQRALDTHPDRRPDAAANAFRTPALT